MKFDLDTENRERKKREIRYIRNLNSKLRILDILDFYDIEYEDNGNGRYVSLCPFHDDHSPSLYSFTENDSGQDSWCCWVCDDNGDCFRFIQFMEENYEKSKQVARDIINKTGNKTNRNRYRENYKKQKLKKKAFLWQVKFSVKCRKWLVSKRDNSNYCELYKKVKDIYKHINDLMKDEKYKELIDFVKERNKKLNNVIEKEGK